MQSLQEYGIGIDYDTSSVGTNRIIMHEHPYYELYFLISGKRRYLTKHTIYDLDPANLILVPKNQLHKTTSISHTGYNRYVLYFTDKQVSAFTDTFGSELFSRLVQMSCFQAPGYVTRQIKQDLEQIRKELENPSPLTYPVLTHLLQGILLQILRYGTEKQPFHGESADKVQMIARYITENYGADINLHMAAEMACMEETYFSKRFKLLTGFGFHEYLTKCRLLEAERLLRETDLSVSQIAVDCGFSGGNYFGDVFHRERRQSPSAYRRKYKDL